MRVYWLLRRALFALDPEAAHHLALAALDAYALFKKEVIVLQPKTVMGLRFPNPLGLAAGFDKDGDHINGCCALGFGFIEVGTVTPYAQPGNKKPRLFRIPEAQALMNAMGFNNKGADHLQQQLSARKKNGAIIGANIGKNKDIPLNDAHKDYLICLEKLYSHADYFVINVSSPNTPGLRELQSGSYIEDLLTRITGCKDRLVDAKQRDVPLLVKTTVDLADDDLKRLLDLLTVKKFAGIVSSNTTIDHSSVSSHLTPAMRGGLSGAPLTERRLRQLETIRSHVAKDFTLISVGGIMSAVDAKAALIAGADLIQLYTGLIYSGPALVANILKSL